MKQKCFCFWQRGKCPWVIHPTCFLRRKRQRKGVSVTAASGRCAARAVSEGKGWGRGKGERQATDPPQAVRRHTWHCHTGYSETLHFGVIHEGDRELRCLPSPLLQRPKCAPPEVNSPALPVCVRWPAWGEMTAFHEAWHFTHIWKFQEKPETQSLARMKPAI